VSLTEPQRLLPLLSRAIHLSHRTQLALIGALVGLFSGLASVSLNTALEALGHVIRKHEAWWQALLTPVAGLLLSVALMIYLFRDADTEGVPDVLYSVGMKGGRLPFRSSLSKLVGNLITISGGGSAGPEGPVIMRGAALGSNVATFLQSTNRTRIAAAGSGAAGAIAAIFNAPIAGIIFTMEVILGEWSSLNLLPVSIASVTATVVSRILKGNQIPFRHRQIQVGLGEILAVVGLAVLVTLVSILFIKGLRLAHKHLEHHFPKPLLRAAIGGLLLGALALLFPQIRGEGYDVIRGLLDGTPPLVFGGVAVLLVMKILATSLTLGAGGTGGVFAPSLVIGALLGYGYHQLLMVVFPHSAHMFPAPTLFVLSSMAGLIAGTLQSPLSGIFLIVEITGGYDVILPLLLVAFLTSNMVRLVEKHSIYLSDLVAKGYLVRPRTDAGVLSDIPVGEMLETDLQAVPSNMRLRELLPIVLRSNRNYYPVIDPEDGHFLGLVQFNGVKEYLFEPLMLDSVLVEEVMETHLPQLSPGENARRILATFDETGAWSLPVVDKGRFLGLISKSTVLDHYRKELKAQTDV